MAASTVRNNDQETSRSDPAPFLKYALRHSCLASSTGL